MTLKSKLWEVPDPLWQRMRTLLDAADRCKVQGRPRTDRRRIMDGIIFKIRTGCQWNLIPKVYGSDTTIYRTLRRWCTLGIFDRIWALLVEEFPELALVDWKKLTRKGSRSPNGSPPPPSP